MRKVFVIALTLALFLQGCDGGRKVMTEQNAPNSTFSWLFCEVLDSPTLCDDTIGY